MDLGDDADAAADADAAGRAEAGDLDELARRAIGAAADADAARRAIGAAAGADAAAPATPIAAAAAPARVDDDDEFVGAVGRPAVAELYSPPRVTAALPIGELAAGSTFDLRADVDGVTWDFGKPDDRRRALERIRAEEPYLVIGSPPCTMLRSLQNLSAMKGTAEWERRRRAAAGMGCVERIARRARGRTRGGRRV